MATYAIIKSFDVGEDRKLGSSACGVASSSCPFGFQRMKEDLRHGVIITAPFPAHAGRDFRQGKRRAIRGTGVLASAIGMKNKRSSWLALSDSHGQDVERALQEYMRHYHNERNHQRIGNIFIDPEKIVADPKVPIKCRSRLGGVLKYYFRDVA